MYATIRPSGESAGALAVPVVVIGRSDARAEGEGAPRPSSRRTPITPAPASAAASVHLLRRPEGGRTSTGVVAVIASANSFAVAYRSAGILARAVMTAASKRSGTVSRTVLGRV